MKFRASSLSLLMTEPKSKDQILSVGAKTYITKLAKEFVYGYDEKVSSRPIEKGLLVENESITLINRVMGTNYVKNDERKSNDWITGECDIASFKIIDVKSSWSLATFPALPKDGEDKGYEWQLRAYMWLWDRDEAEINYCLVNTPEHLIGYEDKSLHLIEHIAPELRLTRVLVERDKSLEDKIKLKVEAANAYYEQVIQEIADQHTY